MKGSLVHNNSAQLDSAAADAVRWGIPLELLETPSDGVWPQNVPAVTAFLRVASLFRMPGLFGGQCGLDYGGVPQGLALAGIEADEELWARIQMIEAGAIDATMRRLQ